ncbi:MAG: AAC(3) family N-acetyltransferase [Clostridiales bacterium]|nr:AAC(3) family N-acetyltransferase [Clostridiales bacterium]
MHSKETLLKQIKELGIKPEDTLLVHSPMKAIGEVEGGADTVLDLLSEYLKEGLLVLPTRTWKQMNDEYPIFNPKTESSCVGILGEIFRQRDGVYRSLHPTHSLAAKGKDAKSFTEGEEKFDTPCNRQGCYGKLYDRKAKILLLGCGFNRNTFLHGVEEWLDVPKRLEDTYKQLSVVMPDGSILKRPVYPHHKPNGINVAERFHKMEGVLSEKGIMRRGKFGDADCMLCDAADMADLVTVYLKKDPDLFGHDEP